MTSLQESSEAQQPTPPPPEKPAVHRRHHHHHHHKHGDDDPFLTLTADGTSSVDPPPLAEPKDSLAVRLLLAPLLALTFVLSLALTDRRARAATTASSSEPPPPTLAATATRVTWIVRVRRLWRPATGTAAAGGRAVTGGETWVVHQRHRATIRRELTEAWDRRAGVLAWVLVAAGAAVALVVVACAWAWARWWG